MSLELDLIKELCGALGFKVTTNVDYKRRIETEAAAKNMKLNQDLPRVDRRINSDNGNLIKSTNGVYYSDLKKPITTFKLTRIENNE